METLINQSLIMQVKEIGDQWTQIQEDWSWKMDSRETDIL